MWTMMAIWVWRARVGRRTEPGGGSGGGGNFVTELDLKGRQSAPGVEQDRMANGILFNFSIC